MSETQELIACCDQLLAELNRKLARVAELLSDAPKSEQPESPSRYFKKGDTIWMIAGDGIYCRNTKFGGWVRAASQQDSLIRLVPEITAEQAEAILKGGGL